MRDIQHSSPGRLTRQRGYLAAGAPVGPHLADQLLLPMALAGGGKFVTGTTTLHTTTNIDVIRWFLDISIKIQQLQERMAWQVTVG